MTTPRPLLPIALLLPVWLAAACLPSGPPAAAPCNDDSECRESERCLAGRCADAPGRGGSLVDGGQPPVDASGPVDAGSDGGEQTDPDGGSLVDAASPAPDAPDDDDGGVDAGDEDAGALCDGPDEDGDGIPDACDNCPSVPNPLQEDVLELESGLEPDGVGDACDPRPFEPGDAIVHFTSFHDLEGWTPQSCTWTVADGEVTQSEGAGARNCVLAWDGAPSPAVLVQARMRVLSLDHASNASAGPMVSLVGKDGWYCNARVTNELLVSRVGGDGVASFRSRTPHTPAVGEDGMIVAGGGRNQMACGTGEDFVYHHVRGGRADGTVALRTNDARASFDSVTIYRLGGDLEVPPLATPRHRYAFNEAADSLTAVDSQGGWNGVLRGDITRVSGSVVMAGEGTGYVDLPNGMLSQYDAVTVEAWVTWDGPNAGGGFWQHLFDFGTTTIGEITDVEAPEVDLEFSGQGVPALMFTPATGDNEIFTRLRDADGFDVFEMTAAALPTGREVHVALTYDPAANAAALYVDGGQRAYGQGTMPLAELHDVNCWIGRSGWSHDERFDGAVHDFRIYGQALHPVEVLGSFFAGPNAP